MRSTKIICFEGIDGSGKTVQFGLLKQYLQQTGRSLLELSFPAYDSFFGSEIGALLAGDDAVTAATVDPKSMALWYGLDRWKQLQGVDLAEYDYVLLNRFTLSNAVYQSIRVADREHSQRLLDWVLAYEHEQLGLPVPDVYIVFDVNRNVSLSNVQLKGHRDYVGSKADVYEASSDTMNRARECYLQVAEQFDHVALIQAVDAASGQMRSQDDIHAEVVRLLRERGIVEASLVEER